jgi:hypothetical protein
VIFESADSTFSGVVAVDAGRSKLEVDVLLAKEDLEGFGAFVVQALEAGLEAGGTEPGMEDLVAGEDGGTGFGFEGVRQDTVAIIVV